MTELHVNKSNFLTCLILQYHPANITTDAKTAFNETQPAAHGHNTWTHLSVLWGRQQTLSHLLVFCFAFGPIEWHLELNSSRLHRRGHVVEHWTQQVGESLIWSLHTQWKWRHRHAYKAIQVEQMCNNVRDSTFFWVRQQLHSRQRDRWCETRWCSSL